MRALLVIAIAACGSGKPAPAGPPPPSGWRADLRCVEDPACPQQGSDCTTVAPPLGTPQCGGAPRPPRTEAQDDRLRHDREAQIDAKTLPCTCSCATAEAAERQRCIMAP